MCKRARRSRRRQQYPNAVPATRTQSAIGIFVLFSGLCLVSVFANSPMFEKIMPFVAASLTLVLNYYFGGRRRQ